MYKKTLIFIIDFLIIYIFSVFFSEILNFIYITPFISPFLFFESLIVYGFFNRYTVVHMSFVFGVISDIMLLNKVFFFSALFPAVVFLSVNMLYNLKIDKYYVCLFFYILYAVFIYFVYSIPILLLLFLFVSNCVFYTLLNYIFYTINMQSYGKKR